MPISKTKKIKSATRLLLAKTYRDVWFRGVEYVDKGRIKVKSSDEKEIRAEALGSRKYSVSLKFVGGGIGKFCDCPYSKGGAPRREACKHIVAVAIVWDEKNGIARPKKDEIEAGTIPPPLVSHSQIMEVYNNPLEADLEVLRLASEMTGSWSRPHARLPNMPKFQNDLAKPLSVKSVSMAFDEIQCWTSHHHFDPYFCAGEMVAAFCEVLRLISARLAGTSSLVCFEILIESQAFNNVLIGELIDDSDGHWQITSAHLDDLFEKISKMKVPTNDKKDFAKKLKTFDLKREEFDG